MCIPRCNKRLIFDGEIGENDWDCNKIKSEILLDEKKQQMI